MPGNNYVSAIGSADSKLHGINIRKAYADMYMKEEKCFQKGDCFPAPITGSF